jgi:hypothetical protein
MVGSYPILLSRVVAAAGSSTASARCCSPVPTWAVGAPLWRHAKDMSVPLCAFLVRSKRPLPCNAAMLHVRFRVSAGQIPAGQVCSVGLRTADKVRSAAGHWRGRTCGVAQKPSVLVCGAASSGRRRARMPALRSLPGAQARARCCARRAWRWCWRRWAAPCRPPRRGSRSPTRSSRAWVGPHSALPPRPLISTTSINLTDLCPLLLLSCITQGAFACGHPLTPWNLRQPWHIAKVADA